MSASLCAWGRWPKPGSTTGERITVPAPNTDPGSKYLWDLLIEWAPELGRAGFDLVQLPPVSKAQGGNGAGCDGYGVNYRRDLGDFDWQGSVETRYGSAASLRRAVAVMHTHGIQVRLDVPLHQLVGGQAAGVYEYPGADGKLGAGRGAMQPGCFRRPSGTQPQDPVASPSDDFGFGDELVYRNCEPRGYTMADAIDYGDWLSRTTGADQGRMDDGKGLWQLFMRQFMDQVGGAWLTEWFDGDPAKLAHYVWSQPMNGRSAAADFNAHFAIADACNSYTAWPLAQLRFAQAHPDKSVIFVDNPDTDQNGQEGVVFNKLLGYCRALTAPCLEVSVYGKDYFPSQLWPGAYGLKPWIDNLVWVHQALAYGSETVRWCDQSLFISERDGHGGAVGQSGGLLIGINFDTWNARAEWVPTTFGANVHLHDYTGHGPDLWTNAFGWVCLPVASNRYSSGQSYVCYGRAGIDAAVRLAPRATTQRFYGAPDLRRGPATHTPAAVENIHVCARTRVHLHVVAGSVAAHLVDANGNPLPENTPIEGGLCTVVVEQIGPLASGDFQVEATYLGA